MHKRSKQQTEFHGLHHSSVVEQGSVCQLISQRLTNKWTYLIANNIKMSQKLDGVIQLSPNCKQDKIGWVIKLIQAGETQLIFVEDLQLDEFNRQYLQQLCAQYNVVIVNLNHLTKAQNVLVGPW